MSVKNLGFPLPIKIEEDQKLFIDLDTEGSSPEDIVIEWHLEIRRFFGSYSAASGEIKLVSIMKEYITAITERAIHFEDIVRLQEMVEHHMEHIYWFYQDSDICFSDMYLDYMEHIMTFYVNLTLRVLLVLKKKIKVTQKKVMDMTQKVIKRLSFYLLQNEYHIFHVLIRQTTTLVDGMIKDVMNILNSNICKQMFRNLYMHFLVLTPVRDMSDEAFCRAFILFENWKAFEDYKQNEKIDECIKNIFNRDVRTIRDNEFLSRILTPKASIMSELMKVMGCDPSITKAYFDYIKSKQKADGEIIDDIGKLALEDALLTETELADEEDDEEEYIEFFHTLMGDAKYNLNEVVLDCKSERNSTEAAVVNEDAEILVLDTDSDSDVEIVSIIPSQNSLKRMSASSRRSRNPATNSQPVTSFLESISVDVDTARRKYGFRTLGNTPNSQQNKTTETSQTPAPTLPSIAEEQTSNCPDVTETCLILDDDICETTQDNSSVDQNKDHPTILDIDETVSNVVQDESVTNMVQGETITNIVQDEIPEREETSRTVNVAPTPTENSSLSNSNISEDLPAIPVEIEIPNAQPADSNETTKDPETETVEVSPSPERNEDSVSKVTESSPATKEALPVPKTNGTINHVRGCPQLLQAPEPDIELTDVVPVITQTTPENVKVVVERIPPLEEFSEGIMGTFPEDIVLGETTVGGNDSTEPEVGLIERRDYVNTAEDLETDFERLTVEPAEVVIDGENPEMEVEQSSRPVPDELVHSEEDVEIAPPRTENLNASSKIDALLTEPEQTGKVTPIEVPENSIVTTSDKVKEVEGTDDSDACLRTLECDESPEIQNCDVESEVLDCRTESSKCDSGCGREETIEHVENNVDFSTDPPCPPVEITPLDTGQDLFVRSLDTGQFDPNSPASPDPVDKPSNDKKIAPLLRKGQPHGEFGYPTPPGSEEEREKDSDEQTQLIYSNILPTKSFGVDASPDFDNERVAYEALTPKNVPSEDFLCEDVEVDCVEISTADAELLERLSDEEKGDDRNASPSLGKSYEQIVKDAVGSQNSTEDEDDETHIVSKKIVSIGKDGDEDISFDDMEQFLKNCDNEDYPQTNRKKRKRPREKTIVDERSKKNACARSPKRVKINEKPEMHFIPTSYDEDSKDDVWGKQNEYDSSSSSDNDESGRSIAKRRPSPMPLSKYLSKRNGANTHIPLSGRLTPDKPPPLKGILKRIEQKHTYHPLHNVDDEPETVVIVLHQREIGRGKRGSVEVKVYRKSFSAYKIPFDDHKLCHHAFVKLEEIKTDAVDVWGRVSVRTRVYEEELFNQPEKPMYKIVFDKNTPQLNSNDRKYYCDPSISSDSAKPKSTLYESENEQGTVNLSTEIVYINTPDPVETTAEPTIPPISPPCFSPSSNSSSEFSDPTNLIPYQDIERALQVVEPYKTEEDAPDYTLERHESNDGTEKTLVDRIALETIELLSNNADFHKMLRDLNGEVLIENVPLISIEETPGNDLLSNLNSDEQLLKKVCQELESKALVDNLDSQNQVAVKGNTAQENVEPEEQEIAADRICYQADHEIQVSTFSTVPISLHVSNTAVRASPVDVGFPETNLSVLNTPIVTAGYNVPVLSSTIPNPIRREGYCSLPDVPLAHSNYAESNYPPMTSPTFPPKLSPLSPFHQDLYPAYPSNLSNYSERSYSASNSPKIPRNSPIPSPHHQQVYPSVPNLPLKHSGYPETNFSVSKPPSLVVNSSIIPQETYPVPDSSLIHSGYSEINASIASPQIKLPVYNSPHQTLKSFIPNPSVALPVYPENNSLIRNPPSSLISYNSSPYIETSYVSDLSKSPSYIESNCLNPNPQSSYPERNLIVPSQPVNVPPYSKKIGVISATPPVPPYLESVPSLPSTSKCSPGLEPRSLRSSRRFSSNIEPNPPTAKAPQVKTDKRRCRLPKEVLTISQINASKANHIDWVDNNNSKTNPSIYFVQTRSMNDSQEANDPRLGQPLFCAPSPVDDANQSVLSLNVAVERDSLKRLVRKKSRGKKKKRIANNVTVVKRKVPIIKTIAKKSLTRAKKRSKLKRPLQSPRKVLDPAPKEIIAVPPSKTPPVEQTHQSVVLRGRNLPPDDTNKQDKPKAPVRRRGRPPKNAKASANAVSQHNIPSVSNSIPPSIPNNKVSPNERVPPIYHPDVGHKTHQPELQPRVEPLKIIKDPNSKNGYAKVVSASSKSLPLPMPVPKTYNFDAETTKKVVVNPKPCDTGDNEVEFETHLPLKKRKLSMPVQSTPPAQPTTLANVPRTRARKDEISYPATPMLSIADVYMQPRTFKTPAEKKQLPPESSNTVRMRYEPPPDPQFNCSLNAYTPAIYGFGKCPYSVDLDCNPYCPPPILFPPESFSRTN